MYPSECVTQKPLSAFCLVLYRKLCAEPGFVSFMRSLSPRTEERTLTLGSIRAALAAGYLGEEQLSIWSAVPLRSEKL